MTSTGEYFIEVSKKPGLPDGRAVALLDTCQDLGMDQVERFEVGNLYILEGHLSEAALETLCQRLLCDPVAESAQIAHGHIPSFAGTYTTKVTYHRGVTDAVADTVLSALEQLNIQGVIRAATGKVYHLFLREECPKELLQNLSERVLANPVIQNYEVYDSSGRLVVKG